MHLPDRLRDILVGVAQDPDQLQRLQQDPAGFLQGLAQTTPERVAIGAIAAIAATIKQRRGAERALNVPPVESVAEPQSAQLPITCPSVSDSNTSSANPVGIAALSAIVACVGIVAAVGTVAIIAAANHAGE